MSDDRPTEQVAASLTAGVLADQRARDTALATARQAATVDDERIPGVGAESITLRAALRSGGYSMVAVLGLAGFVESIDRFGFTVLAPDIQDSLGVSDSVIGAIGAAFGVLVLLGSVPISSLADSKPRTRIAAAALGIWATVVFVTGFAQNALQVFLARVGSGLGQSYQLPVHGPLLIDTYPIEARGRVFALSNALQSIGHASGPVIAGGIAALIGGDEGWRWVFFVVGVLGVPVVLLVLRLPEPRRGRHEMRAILGEELGETDELPVSLGVAFERLKKIKTFHFFLLGMASLGFALFSVPLFTNLILEDTFGLSAFERGLATSITVLPGLGALALVGGRTDRLFRTSPSASLVFIGALIALYGVCIAVGIFMPTLWLFIGVLALGGAVAQAAFAVVVAPIGAIIPHRLRSRGVAMIGVYIFLFGSFLGSIGTGLLADVVGRRPAVALVVVPASLIGGALIAYGSRFVRQDVALVIEEMEEERREAERLREHGAQSPVVQVRNLDFSYGKVQILFDCNLDVWPGETLALLGTNGAGKSTLLRAISGLGVPDRGTVRLNGRTVTYCDPELRVKLGIVQLLGGNATFPPLTVAENLRMAGFLYSAAECQERITRVCELLPIVQANLDMVAGDLSGGQQQILALAMTLMHDPEVLIIDELSLGLAPIVVESLLEVIRTLKERGQTMIIVEQSVNVALSIADRAVFMEKGVIKFDGEAQALLDRGDLLRAVFLPPAARS